MIRARGITPILAALLLSALGIALAGSDSKQVTPVPKPTAGAGGGQKWAVFVGVSEYDDPAIPDLSYSAYDARAVYEILTDPRRGGYSPANVRLLVSDASDPENRPTRKSIMGKVEVFLSQAGPGDTVLFYFSGHGIEHQGQGYLLPGDAESGPLLPQFAVSLDFLNRSLASNRASQKIVLLDACYSGVGKAIGAGMGDAFAQSLFTEGRVTLASCSEGEQSFEWPDRSASVFTYYLRRGLVGQADYDSDQMVCLTELNRYVAEQVSRWAADHSKQQNPRMLASLSGEIVLARVPVQPSPAVPPPPPLQPLATTATLHVSSEPAGAQVLVDGAARGITPCDLEFDLGPAQSRQIEVVVQKEGHKSEGARITLLRGQTSRWGDARLEPLPKPPAPQPSPITPSTSPPSVAAADRAQLAWPTSPSRRLSGQRQQAKCVTFSPDGSLMAAASTGSSDSAIVLWDSHSGQLLRTLSLDLNGVSSLAFSADGQLLAVAGGAGPPGWDHTVELWDAAAGIRLLSLFAAGPDRCTWSATVSPDGRMLATGSSEGGISLWEAGSGRLRWTSQAHRSTVLCLAFSPDGRWVASGGFADNTVTLHGLSGALARTLAAPWSSVNAVAFSPDGRLLAAGGGGQVAVWDVSTGELLRTVGGGHGDVYGVSFSPDGKVVAAGSYYIDLWEVDTGRLLTTLPGHVEGGGRKALNSVAFSADGRALASAAHDDPSIGLWQMPEELWVR